MIFGILSHCQKVRNPLVVNEYLKSKGIRKAMWKDSKLVLSLRDLHKRKVSIIKKPSLQSLQMTLLEFIMALVAHFDLELHQMDVKTAFLNGNIDETIYMLQPENFVSGDPKNMVCKLKNPSMCSNKRLDNGISNFIK